MADNRPTVYQEGGKWIYRASGSGSCLKYLVAIALGYDEQRGKKWDDLLERSAQEGHFHEDTIIQILNEAGHAKVERAQEEVNIQVIPKVFLRGHIEGLLWYPKHRKTDYERYELLEIKSMSNKQFQKWVSKGFGNFPKYAFQLSTYMQAFPDYDVRYIVKRREDGFTNERVIPAGQPPVPFSDVRKKIVLAEKYRRAGELPPCDTNLQWGCPVWYLHDEEDPDDVVPLSEHDEEVLGELVEKYKKLKEIEDRGEEAKKERKKLNLNKEILNMLGKLDQAEIDIDGKKYRVTRRKGGGTKLDEAKLLELLGEDQLEEARSRYSYQYPIIREIE